jgi:serine/threonine-protein kinase
MSVDLRNFDLKEGDLLAGKFRVERLLGSGGMGVVVEATHVTLKDRVALKFLRSPKFADQTTITRFLREAQAAARIKSPHVARVLDVGTLDDGSPYMVMEFLEGTDLGTLLEREGVLPIEQAIAYALQTCEALAAAHTSNVVHRDVKPSNLFLTYGPDREPVVKVLDFGISKMLDGNTSGSITETQRGVGSPSYMAPEQMRSAKRVDARADIWSMGVVLYEFLSGQSPFVADTIPELYALILDKTSRPTPLRSLRAEVPEELERVVDRCLEKDVEARFGDVAELAAALAPFGGAFGPVSAARTKRIIEAAALAGNVIARAEPSDRGVTPRTTPTLGTRSPSGGPKAGPSHATEQPATVRQGRMPGAPASDRDPPASASPSDLTATSFAEGQSSSRPPRKLLAASLAAGAVALVVLAVLLLKSPSGVPSGPGVVEKGAPAALVPPRDPIEPHTSPTTAPTEAPPIAEPAASLPAPSASVKMAPAAAVAVPRSAPRPKPPAAGGDDVLLHRK